MSLPIVPVPRHGRTLALVAAGGVALAAIVATAADVPAHDAYRLMLYALLGAVVAGAVGAVALEVVGRRGVRSQAIVTALVPVVATVVGTVAASMTMFISTRDLRALLVVLVGSGTVGLVVALWMGRRVAAASRGVGELALRLGHDDVDGIEGVDPAPLDAGGPTSMRNAPVELARLGAQLEATSARLAESRSREQALERSRRELVAWVSHDLRTPLAGIRAMVEALEDGVVTDPGTVERYHRTMRLEADRLALLVDDLFELSRIQAGALSLALERVSLDELVSDAVAGASAVAAKKGVRVEGGAATPAPVVELSTPEMVRVVRNLLDNAIRHTPADGTVVIEAAVVGDRAVVSVTDACGGIPEHDLDRVFDLAYRGDTARTPDSGGAGLGLAIARGLVQAHHGEIDVRNEGPGCRFTVRLPLVAAGATGAGE